MAEALPALLHVSLFLFFVALADYVLDINTTVGLGSVIPIGISGLFYVFATFSQVLYSHSFCQSQNSFFSLVRYSVSMDEPPLGYQSL